MSIIPKYLSFLNELQNLDLSSKQLFYYSSEFFLNLKFSMTIRQRIKRASGNGQVINLGGWVNLYYGSIIYSIVRLIKPTTIVETGVGPGGSSACILLALNRNSAGTLYSIDLPDYDLIAYPQLGREFHNVYFPPGYHVGWMVPEWLKSRWKLFIGDAKEKLPSLVSSISPIGVFLHDSLHTDEHINFELNTVFPHMMENSVILADDVNNKWSLAFVNWCNKNHLRYSIFGNQLGVSKIKNSLPFNSNTIS